MIPSLLHQCNMKHKIVSHRINVKAGSFALTDDREYFEDYEAIWLGFQ